MAKKVTVQVLGGGTKTYDNFNTIGDVKKALNLSSHTAQLNGDPANDGTGLTDFAFVSLTPAVKGG